MRYAKTIITRLLPALLVICIDFPAVPSMAQVQTPLVLGAQTSEQAAVATGTQALVQGIGSATQRVFSPKPRTHAQTPSALEPSATAKKPQAQQKSLSVSQDAPPPPPRARPPSPSRSTLFVEIGQHRLRLEAPEKMCFIDKTASPMQAKIYAVLAAMAEKQGDQVLLAVFMNCNGFTSPENWDDGVPDSGFITWMNPAIGETTPMNRQDYLDMREASFPQYTVSRIMGLHPDKKVHRNEDNVSMGMTDEVGEFGKRKCVTVLSTTTLHQVPVEITLRYAGEGQPKLGDVYAEMDKLMAQQIALNK